MFLKNGFDDFLSKPVTGKSFSKILTKWLSKDLIHKSGTENKRESLIPENFIYPDSSVLDVKSAVENADGFENWLNLAKIFEATIDQKSSEIEKYLTANDYKNYTIQVHALKSSARIIGAMELSKKAEYLENQGRKLQADAESTEELVNEVRQKTGELLKTYRYYKTVFKDVLSYEKKSVSKTEISEMELNTVVDEIIKNAEDCNLMDVESGLNRLKEFELPQSLRFIMPELESAVMNIEYDKIIQLLKNM